MAATLWSNLPSELLQQIFKHLPPPDIIRLQCLSKEWKWNVTSRDSEFQRACAQASPKMFAMVSKRKFDGSVAVKLFDIKANRWHSYVHELHPYYCHIDTLYAGDGGLVCVVSIDSTTVEVPLIIVFNPLYPERSQDLPSEAVTELELPMVQLVMDRDRRCYKVLAVGEKNGGVVAKIFSSESGAWDGEISEGLVFGQQFDWKNGGVVDLCAYDSVGRQVLELDDDMLEHVDDDSDDEAKSSLCYALVKDHLYVLHDDASDMVECRRFCISEYRGQKCEPNWVKLRTHRCNEFERPRTGCLYKMSLYACKGFLLVEADNEDIGVYRNVLTWLYDMATEKWQAVPPFVDEVEKPSLHAMFEVQWHANPEDVQSQHFT